MAILLRLCVAEIFHQASSVAPTTWHGRDWSVRFLLLHQRADASGDSPSPSGDCDPALLFGDAARDRRPANCWQSFTFVPATAGPHAFVLAAWLPTSLRDESMRWTREFSQPTKRATNTSTERTPPLMTAPDCDGELLAALRCSTSESTLTVDRAGSTPTPPPLRRIGGVFQIPPERARQHRNR